MKKYLLISLGAALLLMNSCVEKSQKYKNLQARVDSLSTVAATQNQEMETMLAGINDISSGIESLRDAEQILTLEAAKEGKAASRSQQELQRLRLDVQAMTEAIASYRAQIDDLQAKNKTQSAQFQRMIANLKAELAQREERLTALTAELQAANKALALKTAQAQALAHDVDSLDRESQARQQTIAAQDSTLHQAHYLIGSRKALKEAGVISRQGIFCPPIVSLQVENAGFTPLDLRETKSIPLGDKKAKVLSSHPASSYSLEPSGDGTLTLQITDEAAFWHQTRYLVVMVG